MPLGRGPDAITRIQTGPTRGKTLIQVADSRPD